MSYHGHFERQKMPKKKMKRGKKIALIILGVLLSLVLLVAGVLLYAFSKLNSIPAPTEPETTAAPLASMLVTQSTAETLETTEEATTVETTRPPMSADDIINILLVGQSSRAGEEGRLADTMILASVNTYTKTLTLTSFLRDAYVDLPDYKGHTCGWNKLTSCYALGYSWGGTSGAMEMMNICLKDNFGVDVDYNVEIDFDCFIELVNILDGVGIEITKEEADYLNNDDLFVQGEYEAGWVSLGGSEALSYARMRKAEGDNDSDIKRTARQRKLIDALLNNVKVIKLKQIKKIIDEVLPMISTDMSAGDIAKLLMEVGPILPELRVEGGTCPVEKLYWSELKETPDGEVYVLCFDRGQNTKLMRVITEGESAN